MSIQFKCSCGEEYNAAPNFAGAKIKCLKCKTTIVIPSGMETPGLPGTEVATPQCMTERQQNDMICPVCQCPLQPEESRGACPECLTQYHEECWKDNNGCAIYGCGQVPPTEHRENIEIPVSFWGQEKKSCPACGMEILAAALRCRNCGAIFQSAQPENRRDFRKRKDLEEKIPAMKRTALWIFILNIVTCTAPVVALWGTLWYTSHREEIKVLPALYSALCLIGIMVGGGQTIFITIMVLFYAITSGGL